MANQFKDAARAAEGVEAAEAALVRELRRKCDWDDPEDRAFHQRQRRSGDRLRSLKALGFSGRCPYCKRGRVARRMVIITCEGGEKIVACRSCAVDAKRTAEREELADQVGSLEVFPTAEIRFTVDGVALARARSFAGLSCRGFAQLAGWTASYQRKLEGPVRSVKREVAETILTVLVERGHITADNLPALIQEAHDGAP